MKTSQELTERLKESLDTNLKAVILFGSAAIDDQTQKFSNINILVVLGEIGIDTLKKLGPLTRQWEKAGNPAPLLFTKSRFNQAADVFPLEFLDIKASRKILYGVDPLETLKIHTDNLRHQLEYELRGKLIQLRQRYLEIEGKSRDVEILIGKSISTFAILFKGVLRMIGEEPLPHRADVFGQLKKHVDIDEDTLHQILAQRENKRSIASADELFSRLLKTVESVIDFVDNFKEKEKVR